MIDNTRRNDQGLVNDTRESQNIDSGVSLYDVGRGDDDFGKQATLMKKRNLTLTLPPKNLGRALSSVGL